MATDELARDRAGNHGTGRKAESRADPVAKAIYICRRDRNLDAADETRLAALCKQLVPNNIMPRDHLVSIDGTIGVAIINGEPAVIMKEGNSILLGRLYQEPGAWAQVRSPRPDGSYALFRDSVDCLQICSDVVASRTIWYYMDEKIFVASTSQRAMAMYLGSFNFDRRVIPWVLSTGSLGPVCAWDQNVRRAPPDASITLNKKSWTIEVDSQPVVFKAQENSSRRFRERLTESIADTMETLRAFDLDRWVLPLSGGYDSRAILCFAAREPVDARRLQTITWGLSSSLNEKDNDAFVARSLADAKGVAHRYYTTDLSGEHISDIVDRFLFCGEGRIDHIAGYLDGMQIWKTLVEDGVHGIIRGDEGFGWTPVSSPLTVRYSIGCNVCGDFSNLKHMISKHGLPDQELPEELEQKPNESLATWRDRLYHSYRIPVVLAALSDIKHSYLEQINPLLSRRILSVVREMPDHLRTDKALFRQIVESISPAVAYARQEATARRQDIFGTREFVELISEELRTDEAVGLFGADFLADIRGGLEVREGGSRSRLRRLIRRIKAMMPQSIKNRVRDSAPYLRLDGNVLAFRVSMMSRMLRMLREDSRSLGERP